MRPSTSPPRPCLFCEDDELPKTNEHVIQKALGSTLYLRDEVCTDCNSDKFSTHDKRFVDFVKQLYAPTLSGFVGVPFVHGRLGHHFNDVNGVWTTVRPEGSGWLCLPQVAKQSGGSWVATVATATDLDVMLAELLDSHRVDVTTELLRDLAPPFQTSIIRSARRCYLIRGSETEDVEKVAGLTRTKALGPKVLSVPRTTSWRADIERRGEIPFGSVARSLAKNAVNFICAVYGSAVARSPALRDLKGIALGARLGLEDETVQIQNFATESTAFDAAIAKQGRHVMMIEPIPGAVRVPVVTWLYGRRIGLVNVPANALLGDPPMAVMKVDDRGVSTILRWPRDIGPLGDFWQSLQR